MTLRSLALVPAALVLAFAGPAAAATSHHVTLREYDSVRVGETRHKVQTAFGTTGQVVVRGVSAHGVIFVEKVYIATQQRVIYADYRKAPDSAARLTSRHMCRELNGTPVCPTLGGIES